MFCKFVTQSYASLDELYSILPHISIYGPNALNQHYILHDALGQTMIIEMINGQKVIYYESGNSAKIGKTSKYATNSGFGICTNEPQLNWHYEAINHFEWKRSLARTAIGIPGSYYPDDRFMRVYMIRKGMLQAGLLETSDFNKAFSLTAQVMNSISVPEGSQFGTDSGESSGEGDGDHSIYGIIRNHAEPAIYWRDCSNPSFRRIRLQDLDFSPDAPQKVITLEKGPSFIDMTTSMSNL